MWLVFLSHLFWDWTTLVTLYVFNSLKNQFIRAICLGNWNTLVVLNVFDSQK